MTTLPLRPRERPASASEPLSWPHTQVLAHTTVGLPARQLERKAAQLRQCFAVAPECSARALDAAVRNACALDLLMRANPCDGLVLCPTQDGRAEPALALGASLLAARGLPVAGGGHVRTLVAMLLLHALGAPVTSASFVGIDLERDAALWSHHRIANPAVAPGQALLQPGPGAGELAATLVLDPGPATVLGLVEPGAGKLALQYGEGWVVERRVVSRPFCSEIRFQRQVSEFTRAWRVAGTDARFAIGLGHLGPELERMAARVGLSVGAV
jgi:L-arabinose isomerase